MENITFLSIMGLTWEVHKVPSDSYMLYVNENACRGATHFSSRSIYISNSLSDNDLYIVLTHEITHAVLYDSQIESKESYTEENVCDFVGMYGKLITDIADSTFEKLKGEGICR